MAIVTAQFKTAYLQREVVMDAILSTNSGAAADGMVGANDYKVGDLVKYTKSTNTLAPVATAPTTNDGTYYFFAQSDQTMGYGHVPVENRDYRYNPSIAKSAANTTKKVALFQVVDFNDVIFGSRT